MLWGREEPSCGRLQGSHQLIHPHCGSITGRKGRRFNSRAKKPSTRRGSLRNPSVLIGREWSGTGEPTVCSANPESLGGDPNKFRLREQRGAVDLALQADSAVPLARAVVALTLTGPFASKESLESVCYATKFPEPNRTCLCFRSSQLISVFVSTDRVTRLVQVQRRCQRPVQEVIIVEWLDTGVFLQRYVLILEQEIDILNKRQ